MTCVQFSQAYASASDVASRPRSDPYAATNARRRRGSACSKKWRNSSSDVSIARLPVRSLRCIRPPRQTLLPPVSFGSFGHHHPRGVAPDPAKGARNQPRERLHPFGAGPSGAVIVVRQPRAVLVAGPVLRDGSRSCGSAARMVSQADVATRITDLVGNPARTHE